jgi:hypothetical protein
VWNDYLITGIVFYLPALAICLAIMRLVPSRAAALMACVGCVLLVTWILMSIEVSLRAEFGTDGPSELWRAWAAPLVLLSLPFVRTRSRDNRQGPAV